MRQIKFPVTVFILTLSFLAACNGQKSGQTNQDAISSQSSKAAGGQETSLSPQALQGKTIANHNGCMNCHTTNGKTLTGPTFKNLYGHKTTLKDGSSVTVDSAYIVQSMKYPSKKITAGYAPVMPDYSSLTDHQMEFLVAYLRALSDVDSSAQ